MTQRLSKIRQITLLLLLAYFSMGNALSRAGEAQDLLAQAFSALSTATMDIGHPSVRTCAEFVPWICRSPPSVGISSEQY